MGKSIVYDEDDIQTILGQRANRDLNINAEKFKARVTFNYAEKKAKVTITPVKPKQSGGGDV